MIWLTNSYDSSLLRDGTGWDLRVELRVEFLNLSGTCHRQWFQFVDDMIEKQLTTRTKTCEQARRQEHASRTSKKAGTTRAEQARRHRGRNDRVFELCKTVKEFLNYVGSWKGNREREARRHSGGRNERTIVCGGWEGGSWGKGRWGIRQPPCVTFL